MFSLLLFNEQNEIEQVVGPFETEKDCHRWIDEFAKNQTYQIAPNTPNVQHKCDSDFRLPVIPQTESKYMSKAILGAGVDAALAISVKDRKDEKHDVKILIEAGSNGVFIYPEGYGEYGAIQGYGSPVFLEIWDGELRVIVSPNINEDLQKIISLELAKESNRE